MVDNYLKSFPYLSPDIFADPSRVGVGSRVRRRPKQSADMTKENTSTRIASGAVMTCTRIPPRDQPAISENAPPMLNLLLPSARLSLGTTVGKNAWSATSKITVRAPTRNATT